MVKVISIGPNEGPKLDDVVQKHDALVKFYDPNCPHCVAMAKNWEDLGKLLEKDYEGDESLVEVHASALPEIKCTAAQNVKGYPTIMHILKGGKMGSEYRGNRSTTDMLKFMEDKLKIKKKKPMFMNGGSKKYNKSKRRRSLKSKRKIRNRKVKSRRVNRHRSKSRGRH